MWEWTKQPNVDREHFPNSCLQDRLPWSQKEAKMFWDIISHSELLQFQKENTKKEQFSRLHGVESLNGLSARVTYYQTVLTGLTVLYCSHQLYHVKQLLLETAEILSRKAAGSSEKRCAQYHPSNSLGIWHLLENSLYREFMKAVFFTGGSNSYQLTPVASCLETELFTDMCIFRNK